MESESLKGRRVLVTQSSVFVGPVLCELLAARGAEVVANDERLDAPEAAERIVRDAGTIDALLVNLGIPAAGTPAAALDLLNDLQLAWTDDLDEGRFRELDAVALCVWYLPATAALPVRVAERKVAIEGNVLHIAVPLEQRVAAELREQGGKLLVDLVCDALLDRTGRPVSSSLRPLLFGEEDVLLPGGLLRVGLAVRGG